MLKITEYAEKLNRFFNDQFKIEDCHYTITVQLNFTIDVSLFVRDPMTMTREALQDQYLIWLVKESHAHPEENKTKDDCIQECNRDFHLFFKNGSVKFFLNELGDPGDPGEEKSGIQWGPRYRLSSLIHSNREKKAPSLPAIVTFYSYKGGMGRTTTLMALAMYLANHGKRVAIIDCDLEAPGYLNFFNLANQKLFIDGQKNGFVEFVADSNFKCDEIDVDNYTVIPSPPEDNEKAAAVYGNIFIVPGGNLNDAFVSEVGKFEDQSSEELKARKLADENRKDFIEGLARVNLSNPEVMKRSFLDLIKKLQKKHDIDIVLIDSRTGFNDIYGSVAFSLSDEIVAFFGFSKQTMPGLRQLLESYRRDNFVLKSGDESTYGITLCNSILPSESSLLQNSELSKKWEKYEEEFRSEVTNFCDYSGISDVPMIFPIHRSSVLEEIGMDNKADLKFMEMAVDNKNEDYSNLFQWIEDSLTRRGALKSSTSINSQASDNIRLANTNINDSQEILPGTDFEGIRRMRPLNLTKVILRELRQKLSHVQNFAEKMEVNQKATFLYRDCMGEIFNPDKFIIRGFKGAGKTCIYQALGGSLEIAEFVQDRAGVGGLKYEYINVLDFKSLSNHPLKLLEEDGVFNADKFLNINAIWQILTWNAIFSDNRYASVIEKSELKNKLFKIDGKNGNRALLHIRSMIENGVSSTLASIEDDFDRLDAFLQDNNQKLLIMYDGLDNVIKPKYWSKAVSPLINKWGGNISAYSHIHPKIFLRTDLFERIEGTNTERLRENIVDIDWSVGEIFGYLFKLILGEEDNPSREAMWCIIRKLRRETAEATIDNMTRAIGNGKGQFSRFDRQNLQPLVEIFFGREVNPKNAHLGRPWDYFEKQLSNAAGKLSLRLFINTLTTDVIDKGLENSNGWVREIISPEIYASREVRIKVAESYFNDLASEEDFTVDLQRVREFINSEQGADYRLKTLSEAQFNDFLNQIFDLYGRDMRAVDSSSELAQLIYASGLMKEVYKPGRKIYRFAAMYEYAWGLQGKSDYDEDSKTKKDRSSQSIQEGGVLEGVLCYNLKGRLSVKVNNRYYECDPQPRGIKINSPVRFIVRKLPKVGGGFFWESTSVEKIE